jgi:hypothetical protein
MIFQYNAHNCVCYMHFYVYWHPLCHVARTSSECSQHIPHSSRSAVSSIGRCRKFQWELQRHVIRNYWNIVSLPIATINNLKPVGFRVLTAVSVEELLFLRQNTVYSGASQAKFQTNISPHFQDRRNQREAFNNRLLLSPEDRRQNT